MSEDKIAFRLDRSVLFLNIRIVLTVLIFLSVATIMLYDNLNLKGFITHRTKKFAQDLTFQHAASITKEFNTRMLNMNMIADSLVQTNSTSSSQQLLEFLARKAELSVFNELYFIGTDDLLNTNFHDTINLTNHELHLPHVDLLLNTQELDHACITYDGVSNIYYTRFVAQQDKPLGILVGVRGKHNLQDLIQLKALNNQTVSCIVDKNSGIVVAPTNAHLKQDMNLDNFVMFTDTQESKAAIKAVKENIASLTEAVHLVRNNQDKSILITYTPLGINDWGLVTFIPENLIAVGSQDYILRTLLISVVSICLFGIIAITAFISYKNNKRQMERIAFHDMITGGLNNEGFQLRFHEIVAKAKGNTYAVALINIRNFKLINEKYGKKEGDRTLKHIHHSITTCLKANEFTGRISADRFFICLREHQQEAIEGRLKDICREINSFNTTDSPFHLLEFHCGVQIVDDTTADVTRIQDHARQAYDLAIRENLFCVFYQKSFTEKLLWEQELDMMFETSLRNKEFKLYLQPKVDLETGTVCGAEALVRWLHPEKGFIFPSDFIPLFEGNGKICQLDAYMFEEVCKVLHRWHQQGRHLIPISVNLSRQHYFRNPEFLDTFAQLAQHYQIPPKLLDFELTESIFFDSDQFNSVKKSLKEMHDLGFLCSLDDFGVGFSSLGLLKEFDIDTIKFDRQFFLDVSTKKSKTILESLMRMSEELGIKTVAEGIETREQLTYLNETSCDMIQGYIFSLPLEVSEFELWLDSLENRKPSIPQK